MPNTGYRFTGWTSGNCTGTNATCSLTNITANQSSVANFELLTYTVVATAGTGGTASCTVSPVSHGGSSTCTAVPSYGYRFVGWSGSCVGATATCDLTNITQNQSSQATFELLPTYTVVATYNGNGTASCTPAVVPQGGSSVCTATPAPGSQFTGWTGACAGQGLVCTLTNISANQASVAQDPPAPQAIPTLSEWGMMILSGLLAMVSVATLRRRQA